MSQGGNEVDVLQEMGFPRNRAEKALGKTNFRGVQAAMEWLLEHQDDPDIDEPYTAPQGHTLGKEETNPAAGEGSVKEPSGQDESNEEAAASQPPTQALSLKCEDCGKQIKSEIDAQAHAARTGHANFSESTEEIKPLTEEERKEQLEKIQEKMKQRRQARVEAEKQDALAKEKMRRVTGKEMTSIRQKMQDDEIRKIAEFKRREKEEEKKARQKVKEQIERDKRERAAKFSKQKQPEAAATATSPVQSPPATQPAEKKQYDQTRIQVRLTNGQALTQSFGCKEPLAAVRLYIEINRTDGSAPFSLMTTFPRKVFTEDDMPKPLSDLGLVPSAVIVLGKQQ